MRALVLWGLCVVIEELRSQEVNMVTIKDMNFLMGHRALRSELMGEIMDEVETYVVFIDE